MMDRAAALDMAEEFLDANVRHLVGEPVAVALDRTIETEHSFVFFYNTVAYLETRSMVHALAGNGPIVVDRVTGAVMATDSSRPWEEQVE